MKKIVLLITVLVCNAIQSQLIMYQVQVDYNAIYSSGNTLSEPLNSFLNQNGLFFEFQGIFQERFPDENYHHQVYSIITTNQLSNQLESTLNATTGVMKYVAAQMNTFPFEIALDRVIFRYHLDQVTDFLGYENQIAVTSSEELNVVFQQFNVDAYAVTFPNSNWPINLAVRHIRCNGCDVFQLKDALSDIEIIDIADFVGIITLNVSEHNLFQFQLYPNPARESVTIQVQQPEMIGAEVILYSPTGKEVLKTTLTQEVTQLDVKGLSTGLYLVKIFQQDRVWVEKLIVN